MSLFSVERYLRDQLPQFLIRIPTRAQSTSCVGRALCRTDDEAGELGARFGHPRLYDSIDHGWLVKFIKHRIADRRVVRLIQKWLNAGVLEDGKRMQVEEGTPQGGSASPLLSNIYVHYVFDLWVRAWRRKQARGAMIVVRFADDIVLGFQYKSDAERFREKLVQRLRKFRLELHPDKTRLAEFGCYAAVNRQRRG
jgi:RNA-directed DNA polymerase